MNFCFLMQQIFCYLLNIIIILLSNQLLAETKEQPTRVLTVYTHHTFAKAWELDHQNLKSKFQKYCNCKLTVVGLDNGGTLLSRIKLEGKYSKADVALGLDYNLIAEAEKTNLFSAIDIDTNNLNLPIKWNNKYFIPFDYGYLSFVYNKNKLKEVPKSLDELIYKFPGKIIIADPRSSTVGFNFLLWIKSVFDEQSPEAWRNLSEKIVTIPQGWGESYGLFLKGEADMVLSYSTSIAYHILSENNYNYSTTSLAEGHYLQLEVAGKLKHGPNPDLADMFLKFVLSKDFQATIFVDHYMYPVINLPDETPMVYKNIDKPKKTLMLNSQQIHENKKVWILEWLSALSKK